MLFLNCIYWDILSVKYMYVPGMYLVCKDSWVLHSWLRTIQPEG